MAWTSFDQSGSKLTRALSDLPVATIVGTGAASAPTGWLLCDGASVSRASYPELFAAVGTAYGSVDANTFNVPNADGQMIFAVSLAQRLAATSPPQFVTKLPASPIDGTEVYYQSTTAGTGGGATDTMADVGAVWHLRYRAASSSAYKWEFVGGGAVYGVAGTGATDETTTSVTFTDLATVGPSVTVALAGHYEMEFDLEAFRCDGGAGTDAYISFSRGSTAADNANRISNGAGQLSPGSAHRLWTGLTANDVIRAKYAVSSSTGRFRGKRTMFITPIRVSA